MDCLKPELVVADAFCYLTAMCEGAQRDENGIDHRQQICLAKKEARRLVGDVDP